MSDKEDGSLSSRVLDANFISVLMMISWFTDYRLHPTGDASNL